MTMDITAVVERPGLFALGAVWLGFHAVLLLVVGRLIRAPTFYLAVGSQANVGGAASAPIVASVSGARGRPARGLGLRGRDLRRLGLRSVDADRGPVTHLCRAARPRRIF